MHAGIPVPKKRLAGSPMTPLITPCRMRLPADVGLAVTPEEDPVRHDDRTLAGAPEGREEVEQIGVGPRSWPEARPYSKRRYFVVGRVEAVRPGLVGERGIGDGEVEPLEASLITSVKCGFVQACCRARSSAASRPWRIRFMRAIVQVATSFSCP